MSQTKENSSEKVRTLQQDASRVLQDISELSAKLRDVGKSKVNEVGDETIALLQKQLAELESKASSLSKESQKILGQVDKSVRENPYLYILGALGLGMLVGKWVRSQERQS